MSIKSLGVKLMFDISIELSTGPSVDSEGLFCWVSARGVSCVLNYFLVCLVYIPSQFMKIATQLIFLSPFR